MYRKLLINIGVAVLSLTLFISLVEGVLRLSGRTTDQKPSPIYQKSNNPRINYELKPNIKTRAFTQIVTTNSLGFRSQEVDSSKPIVAVLGDSVTFGYAVKDEQTLPSRMQELLPEWNVINGAVPGYNLTQETATYTEKFRPLNPKILVMVFYFNDFDQTIPILDDKNIPRPPDWKPGKCERPPRGPFHYVPKHCWFLNHSVFYKTFFTFSAAVKGKFQQREEQITSRRNPTLDNVTSKEIASYVSNFNAFASTLPASLKKFFVIWPDNTLHPYAIPELQSMAENRGFTVINLYDTFGNEVPTLLKDDVHPSPEGITQAAKAIVNSMKTKISP